MMQLQSEMAALVGAAHVHNQPGAIQGQAPLMRVCPADREELAAVVAVAYQHGVGVVPQGGGTKQQWGHPPSSGFILLDTTRLNRVLIYEPDDLTISVEAGMTLGMLTATLAANGQMLPLDAPLPARSTVGGLLATGIDGPRRLGYSSSRDLLIGVQVVEANGRFSKAGGMVVKNVSGFDMMKLYIGSLGSLAIIVGANFKLIPRPRAAATIACAFEQPAAAFSLIHAIQASQLTPVAVEYLHGSAPPGLEAQAPLVVAVCAEGLPAAVERHVRDVSSMAERSAAVGVTLLRDDPHEAVWAAINDLSQTDALNPDEMVLRLSCLPADLERAVTDASDLAHRHALKLRIVARALSGMAYLRIQSHDAAALENYHHALLAAWPHISLLAGAAKQKAGAHIWGRAIPNLDLMQRIKHEFDPQNRLNPGRYI
ncbi:FAD linked oxidase domain-containing protein [Oscillochloris trichoides DG-6]|uniref:FAD linked oxidase domain-containing protein n=1 Tax=Oscillochloris trichoides DG-6 TaxID=765420 RepID=E1IHB5_9CHLR|nr:FAD-binding oxidoreductase [Oscillochloris trichoides]EFO79590.1 FAD linked oxidase domain-containing protein [Oscillochloris trichoides DG-6]